MSATIRYFFNKDCVMFYHTPLDEQHPIPRIGEVCFFNIKKDDINQNISINNRMFEDAKDYAPFVVTDVAYSIDKTNTLVDITVGRDYGGDWHEQIS